jgi:hypothetical protein
MRRGDKKNSALEGGNGNEFGIPIHCGGDNGIKVADVRAEAKVTRPRLMQFFLQQAHTFVLMIGSKY